MLPEIMLNRILAIARQDFVFSLENVEGRRMGNTGVNTPANTRCSFNDHDDGMMFSQRRRKYSNSFYIQVTLS